MPLQKKKLRKIPCEKGLHISVQANTHLMQSMECSYAQLWGEFPNIQIPIRKYHVWVCWRVKGRAQKSM